jgi:hypothetical protein
LLILILILFFTISLISILNFSSNEFYYFKLIKNSKHFTCKLKNSVRTQLFKFTLKKNITLIFKNYYEKNNYLNLNILNESFYYINYEFKNCTNLNECNYFKKFKKNFKLNHFELLSNKTNEKNYFIFCKY